MQTFDTLFWIQGSSRPEYPVALCSLLNPFARRTAYTFDAFRPTIKKIGLVATSQRLDPCFVSYREARDELRKLYPRGHFVWMPFGIDTDVFRLRSVEKKDIFAFWMGRRYEPLHKRLIEYCEKRNLKYVYSTPGKYLTREKLGEMVSRSQYFVVTPTILDNPARTGGYSPLVMRYLEGLAGGARLLGVLPGSGEYEDLLPVEAICQVAPDGEDLDSVLDADRLQDHGAIIARAGAIVREKHSWPIRAQQMSDYLLAGLELNY